MSTKLTSEIIGYKVTGSFRFWCQHVLPLVYDDSLSYYELLCKVVNYLNDVINNVDAIHDEMTDIINAFNELKAYVDDYFENLDVQEEINNKLDEMAQDGTLSDIINNCGDYMSTEQAWHVIKVKNGYVLTRYFIQTGTVTTYQKTIVGGEDKINFGFWMPDQTKILPLPLDYAGIGGSVESYFGVMTNARVENKCTLIRKTLLFDAAAGPQGSSRTVGTSTIVAGKHAIPPATPTYPVLPKRQDVIQLADSYYQARIGGRKFKYGANAITYAGSNVINDGYGNAMMECDTLVALVMMGIPYNLSPYADDTPSLTFDFTDLVDNPNNLTWPLPWKFNATLNRKVTYTGGENWYFWNNQMVFRDIANASSGDVVIFRKDLGIYFDGIRHIGILNMVDGVPWIYHVTGLSGVESPMMYEPLADVLARGDYDLETNVYFARPNYA